MKTTSTSARIPSHHIAQRNVRLKTDSQTGVHINTTNHITTFISNEDAMIKLIDAYQKGEGVTLDQAETAITAKLLLDLKERISTAIRLLDRPYPNNQHVKKALTGEE